VFIFAVWAVDEVGCRTDELEVLGRMMVEK
jgi:hypothetical protein